MNWLFIATQNTESLEECSLVLGDKGDELAAWPCSGGSGVEECARANSWFASVDRNFISISTRISPNQSTAHTQDTDSISSGKQILTLLMTYDK